MQKISKVDIRQRTFTVSRFRSCSFIFVCLLLAAGCSRENPQLKPVADNSSGMTVLNEGYSMLYQDLDGLSAINKLLYVKLERESVDKVITAIAETAAAHVKALDEMKTASPELRFDLDPLPEMEKRKRKAAQGDRTWGLAPVIGRTGADFERTLLLTLSGAMNQLRYLEGELAKAEVSDARRERLKALKPDLDQRYTDIVDVLNLEYFVHFSDRLTSENAQKQAEGQTDKKSIKQSGDTVDGASSDDQEFVDTGSPRKAPKEQADTAASSDADGLNESGSSESNDPDEIASDRQPSSEALGDEGETKYFGPLSR